MVGVLAWYCTGLGTVPAWLLYCTGLAPVLYRPGSCTVPAWLLYRPGSCTGLARLGLAMLGWVRPGLARLGLARLGLGVWLGWVWVLAGLGLGPGVGKPVVLRQNLSCCAPRVLNLLASKPVPEWVRIFDLRCSYSRFLDEFRELQPGL